jgi:DNA-binding transcriptional ArsR family regulator
MSSSSEPPGEVLTITSAEQHRALGHPLRHRLLFALGQQPATISQLAVALGSHKGNIAHHLRVLREAGLVVIMETRQVRGGTEQYYQRTARRFDLPGEPGAAHTGVLLQAVADEMASATVEPLLVLRNIRLTADQAGRLADTLSELADGLEDGGDAADRYGLLIGLYQPGQPDPAGPDPSAGMNSPFPGSRREAEKRKSREENRDNGSR